MKVKCIEKPHEGLLKRNVTEGVIYDVISKDDNDYRLKDDNDEEWYFTHRFFEEIEE